MAYDIGSFNISQKKIEKERNNLTHNKFLDSLFTELSENSKEFIDRKELLIAKEGEFGSFCYISDEDIRICPEPITFIKDFKDITSSDVANKQFCELKEKEMEPIKKPKLHIETTGNQEKTLNYVDTLNDNIWFGSTLNGVNLRPGLLNYEEAAPYAIPFCDRTVHGVVVGRTGAGKSVFLNNLIFNMLTEYAPWELDLYLVDFKKVEFSRYMTGAKTPHVNACAATSEIRYVVSLLSYLQSCMQARNKLFSVLGLTNIQGFREKYKIVLPRIVLVVDEFQQLFLEATTRESNIINELVMSITKLGRAVGFHLLFASQEMSGALSGKALANFKIRFALPCEAEISSAILGNSAAVDLKIGEVLVNTESGNFDKNRKYKVPFIRADESIDETTGQVVKQSDFKLFLAALLEFSNKAGFVKTQKYYNEDSSSKFESFEKNVLNNMNFKMQRREISASSRYFDVVTLGESVVYSNKKYDYETFFIERGKNKNILAVSPSVSDLAYLTQLLTTNFLQSPDENIKNDNNHLFFAFNTIIDQMNNSNDNIKKFKSVDELIRIERTYQFRNMIKKSLEATNTLENLLKKFASFYCKSILAKDLTEDIFMAKASSVFSEVLASEYEASEYCEYLINDSSTIPVVQIIATVIKAFYDKEDGEAGAKFFKAHVVWISGLENIEKLPSWFATVLKNGMDVNMLFILLTTSEDSARSVLSACDYIFVSGTNPKVYDRCGLNYTNKTSDSIAIDFKIRSVNIERSFKKFKTEQKEIIVRSINFDDIL